MASSLNEVYDAKLAEPYSSWVEQAFGWMAVNLSGLLVPTACISSGYGLNLVLIALAPIALVVVVVAFLICRRLCEATASASSAWQAVRQGLLDGIPFSLVITFYCVSSVSQASNGR